MKDKTLPYFLTIHPPYVILKSLSLQFFPTLKIFIVLPNKAIKLLWCKLC